MHGDKKDINAYVFNENVNVVGKFSCEDLPYCFEKVDYVRLMGKGQV